VGLGEMGRRSGFNLLPSFLLFPFFPPPRGEEGRRRLSFPPPPSFFSDVFLSLFPQKTFGWNVKLIGWLRKGHPFSPFFPFFSSHFSPPLPWGPEGRIGRRNFFPSFYIFFSFLFPDRDIFFFFFCRDEGFFFVYPFRFSPSSGFLSVGRRD